MFKRKCNSLFLVKALFVLAIGLLTISCGTTRMYSGPELPASEVAIIQGSSSVTIHTCDGRKLYGDRVAVLPGVHVFETSYFRKDMAAEWYWSTGNVLFHFTAEAGHTYSIGGFIFPDVKDLQTGRNISRKIGLPREPLDKHSPGAYFQSRNPYKPHEFTQIEFRNEMACLTYLSLGQNTVDSKETAEDRRCSAESMTSLPCTLTIKEPLLNTALSIELSNLETCKSIQARAGKESIIEPCTCDRTGVRSRQNQTTIVKDEKFYVNENGRYFQFTSPLDLQVKAQFDLGSESNCTDFHEWVRRTIKQNADELFGYIGCTDIRSPESLPYKATFRDKKRNVVLEGSFVTPLFCRTFAVRNDKDIVPATLCRLVENTKSPITK